MISNITKSRKLELKEDFIKKYKAALKAKVSREQLAEYMGVKPDSLIRRRLHIFDTTGIDLPIIESKPDLDIVMSDDKLAEFEGYLEALGKNNEVINKSNTGSKLGNTKGVKRYVISAAQNKTPIHSDFFASVLNYCNINDAELIIIPYRYKNPTSVWTVLDENNEVWDAKVMPFLCDKPMNLHERLQVMGHIKIQPTAVQPLSGFDSYTGIASAIFGHPKIQLKTIPTPSKSLPKILTTTGVVTMPNYTDSKTGFKGEFHHSLSAVVVEVEGDQYHIRHIHGHDDDGSFYDLNSYYTTNTVEHGKRIAALVTGDTHAEFIDDEVEKATYIGGDSMVEVLNPETLVWHDIEDFYSRNHHHRGNDILTYGKHHFGRNNVEKSLQVTADFLDKVSRPDTLNVIVKSNHDEAFDRWLREANPKEDPENSRFYYYMKYNQMRSIQISDTGFTSMDPFEFWCANPDTQRGLKNINNTVFLKRDESFVVGGIEVGFHGDRGPNGSYGSVQSFSKIGPKTVIGHSHTPGIYEGAYQVGVSAKLNLEYVSGPSSWLHTHCIIYPDGKRTLINVINGKWRASQ